MNEQELHKAVGQMLVFGWQNDKDATSAQLPPHASKIINELHVGGVVVMGRNAASPSEMQHRLQQLQELSTKANASPLFIAVDQEGGRINRLNPPDYSQQHSQRELAGSPDKDAVRAAAAATGKELRAVGINWDFAPVLDVDNNPDNPVIGDRSFGPDPELCANLGLLAVQGFQTDARILACGKHFPGHGDTDVDSHFGLPRIEHGLARLHDIELVPFKAAINAGIATIMTSHIIFSSLDPDLPATLSPAILTGLLRNELKFDGLIITDCLEMHGVSIRWGSAEAAVLAVIAGADLLLCCHTLETQYAIRNCIVEAVRSGRIPEERILESGKRIREAKTKWLVA